MDKKTRGVITVEAALVMPVVMIVTILIYVLGYIQYENVVARAEAMRVANRTAMNWSTIGTDTHNILDEIPAKNVNYSGKTAISSDSFTKHDPYRFFVDLFNGNTTRTENMKEYLQKQMSVLPKLQLAIGDQTNTEIKSDAGWKLFGRYISVSIENTYASPVFALLDRMGFHVKSDYKVTAKAKLVEPVDFVRNISYIQELIRESKKEEK